MRRVPGHLPVPSVARRPLYPLPPGGVEELQGAFFVERMIDLFSKMAKAEGHLRDDRRIHMKPRFINMSLLRS